MRDDMLSNVMDAHLRLGKDFRGREARIEEYYNAVGNVFKVTGGVVCPNKSTDYLIEKANEEILDITEQLRGNFYAALRVDPWCLKETYAHIRKQAERERCRFIYLNPWEENFRCNSEESAEAMKLAADTGNGVIIEAGYPWVSHISQIVDICRRFKDVKVLATNAGQYDLSGSTLDDVSLAMEKAPNLYLETSGSCGAEWLKNIADCHGDRVLFASNFPQMEPVLEFYRIEEGFFTEEQKRKMFSENLLDLVKK